MRGATFHGKPCRHGHGTLRRVSGKHECVECQRLASLDWVRRNRERNRQNNTQWREANRPKLRELIGRWKSHDTNKARLAESCRFRQARKRCATPPWLSPAHREEMRALYALARRLTKSTGVIHHVDHQVPLKGNPAVCGLHVPWNLQVLTGVDNMRKGAKL